MRYTEVLLTLTRRYNKSTAFMHAVTEYIVIEVTAMETKEHTRHIEQRHSSNRIRNLRIFER